VRRDGAPPFFRPDRAGLFPKRFCCGVVSLPDRFSVPTDEHSPGHWTHAKASTEILTDFDWTDDEAGTIAGFLYHRSVSCFFLSISIVLLVVSFLSLFILPEEDDHAAKSPFFVLLLFLFLVAFAGIVLCGQEVTNNDKQVTRLVDRTFRDDGSRFEILV